MPFLRSARLVRPESAIRPPLAVGQEIDFKIIRMNEAEKKIGLSLKAAADDEERTRLDDYQRARRGRHHRPSRRPMSLKEPEPK